MLYLCKYSTPRMMTLANDYSCVYSYVYPYEHSNLSYPHSNRGLVPLHSFLLALHICIVSTNPEWPLVQWVWVTFFFCPSSVRIVAMHAQRYVRLHLGTPRSLWAEPHQQFARPCRPCKQYRLLRLLFKASFPCFSPSHKLRSWCCRVAEQSTRRQLFTNPSVFAPLHDQQRARPLPATPQHQLRVYHGEENCKYLCYIFDAKSLIIIKSTRQ